MKIFSPFFKVITASLAVLLIVNLTSCSTMKGLGQDIQKLGGKLEGEADEHLY